LHSGTINDAKYKILPFYALLCLPLIEVVVYLRIPSVIKTTLPFSHNKYFILNTMHTDANVKIILLKINIHI
jgi:hypothetical protein